MFDIFAILLTFSQVQYLSKCTSLLSITFRATHRSQSEARVKNICSPETALARWAEELIYGSILKYNLWSELYLWDREASVCNCLLILLHQRPHVHPNPSQHEDLFFLLRYLSFCQSRCLSISACFDFFSFELQISHFGMEFLIGGPGVSDQTGWGLVKIPRDRRKNEWV